MRKIIRLEEPLVALFQPIDVTDDMYSPSEGDNSKIMDETVGDEVVILDDTSEDIVLLEEPQQLNKTHDEEVTANENLQGTKRIIDGDSKESSQTSSSSLSSEEVTLCSRVMLDSTTVYQMHLSPDIVFKIGFDTGAVTPGTLQTHSVDSARYLAMDILVFVFTKVF